MASVPSILPARRPAVPERERPIVAVWESDIDFQSEYVQPYLGRAEPIVLTQGPARPRQPTGLNAATAALFEAIGSTHLSHGTKAVGVLGQSAEGHVDILPIEASFGVSFAKVADQLIARKAAGENIRVLSISALVRANGEDMLHTLKRLEDAGINVVVAGNEAGEARGIGLESLRAPNLLVVAATNADGSALEPYNLRGGGDRLADVAGTGKVRFLDASGAPRDEFTGTSAATPVVAGKLGVLLERFPGLSPGEAQKALLSHADRLPVHSELVEADRKITLDWDAGSF